MHAIAIGIMPARLRSSLIFISTKGIGRKAMIMINSARRRPRVASA
jgi:hypothetical protein